MHKRSLKNILDEYEEKTAEVYFHGTSDIFRITEIRPALETGTLREDWRKNLHECVFLTDSINSAYRYAVKACEKYGGNPVVYEVEPVGDVIYRHTHEYLADAAVIIRVIKQERRN